MAKDPQFGPAITTPRGVLLDDKYLSQPDDHPEYGKDRYHGQIAFSKDADLSELNSAIEKFKAELIDDGYFTEDDILDMPFKAPSTWEPAKGKIVMDPKCKKRPRYVNWARADIDPDVIEAGMEVQARVGIMAYHKSAKAKGFALVFKMLRVDTQGEFTAISGGNESPDDVFKD